MNLSSEERWRESLRRIGQAAIAWDLGDDTVYLAEELVAQAWMLGEHQRIALALLVLALGAAERQGSTCLPLGSDALASRVTALVRAARLEVQPARVMREIRALCDPARPALVSLIGHGNEDRPLLVRGGAIASHRMVRCEERLGSALRGRASAVPPTDVDAARAALADVLARPARRGGADVALSDEQRVAVESAATRALAVVSGGPGTGKTAIAAALCRTLCRTGVRPSSIALCAPTGKAAERLGSSVRGALASIEHPSAEDQALAADLPEGRTLHRLLGYHAESGRFRHHAQAPLAAEVVIADESSMIDAVLMERLVRALAPGARLVLFGDADQLPSVEAGAVLRDLCTAGAESGMARRLTKSYRMDDSDPAGRAVLEVAAAVRAGRADRLLGAPLRADAQALTFAGVERLEPGAGGGVARFVDGWFASRLAAGHFAELAQRVVRLDAGAAAPGSADDLTRLFALLDSGRVLCATRRLPCGADRLNELFHLRAASALAVPPRGGRWSFLPGEPVVMRENDYARGLYNGDAGAVVRVSADGHRPELRAVFPGAGDTWRFFSIEALGPRLDHSFAMTVHQSQGSEHDHVALVLPATDLPLVTRELLYTAITRARRSVALVGGADVIKAAVSRSIERHSGLAGGLAPAAS